jgi:hypothetical protein
MGYRRFAKAADAIRFAIDELSPELLIGLPAGATRRFFRSMNGRTQR